MDITQAIKLAAGFFLVIFAVHWLAQFIPSSRMRLDALFRRENGQIQLVRFEHVNVTLLAWLLHYPTLRRAQWAVIDRSGRLWVGAGDTPTPASLCRLAPLRAWRTA